MATFQFQNPSSGSAYFVIETITTSSLYPVGTPKYMEGTWNVNGIKSAAIAVIDMTLPSASYALNGSGSFSLNSINFIFTGSSTPNDATNIYLDVSAFIDTTADGFAVESQTAFATFAYDPAYSSFLGDLLQVNGSTGPLSYFIYYLTSQNIGNTIPYTIDGVPYTFSGGSNYNFGLVTSSFIAGVVIAPGYSTFEFIPNITIPINTIVFRGTGEYTVTISP